MIDKSNRRLNTHFKRFLNIGIERVKKRFLLGINKGRIKNKVTVNI